MRGLWGSHSFAKELDSLVLIRSHVTFNEGVASGLQEWLPELMQLRNSHPVGYDRVEFWSI